MSNNGAETERDYQLAIVGSFTTEQRGARGDGIRVFRCDAGSGWQLLTSVDAVNPSYAMLSPSGDNLYVAHGDSDFASAYRVDYATGKLDSLGSAESAGSNGVAVVAHPTEPLVFIANYATGSIGTLPVNEQGGLDNATHRLDLPGEPGPHRGEQASSHPHDTVIDPSGRFVIVPDKGLDRVFVLEPDKDRRGLEVVSWVQLRPGSGPRHIAFHPNEVHAYVANEIDSTVTVLVWDAVLGKLTPIWVVPSLPADFFGHSTSAEILVDPAGRFVYVSNRGADCITQFSIDDGGARLSLVGWTATGADPRFMSLSQDASHLVVANEQSDSIDEFRIDPSSGELSRSRSVATPSPSSIVFL